jgi:very-short-patch-repair endonuclease
VRPGLTVHRSPLSPDEIAVVDGIPTTSVFRTAFDLAAVLSMRGLEQAINEAEVRGLTDTVSLPQLLDRHPGKRGAANVRALLAAKSPGGVTRNKFEERFLSLIDRHRLPRPRLNAHLAVDGRFFEIDCLWEDARLAVELDGRASHGTGLRFESDRERDRLLLVAGWRPLRITWRQLVDEEAEVASDLRALLRA